MEEINPAKLLLKVAPILERLDIDYYVTGGFAVSVWGRPRATFDVDIVIHLIEPQIESLIKALCKISEGGYISKDMALRAVQQKGEFNFIDPETGVKVDFWVIKKDKETLEILKRRKARVIRNLKVYFISPEDLISSKIKWYKKSDSTRHLEDIESIIKISGKKLDRKYLAKQAKKLGVTAILGKLMKSKLVFI